MKCQIITGVSGSGKTTYAFDRIVKEAAKDRNRPFIVIVPEQFSQAATGMLVRKNGGGILNIDVLSFHRLAYRALEEMHGLNRTVLTDEGKIMLLRKVIADHREELSFFTRGVDRPGFLDEVKSLLSEFAEYAVDDEVFDTLFDRFDEPSRLGQKLRDLKTIRDAMEERMGETYRMAEEMLPLTTEWILNDELPFLRDATICLDGFTGFTPVQAELIGAMMQVCREILVTVTCDRKGTDRKSVFSLSRDTIHTLTTLARSHGAELIFTETGYGSEKDSYRLRDNPVLNYLERSIFSYHHTQVPKQPVRDAIEIRLCHSEREEANYAARTAARLIREGMAPEKIAVVTGELDDTAPFLERAFHGMGLPYFIDRKKSLGTNPLAEYIDACLDMIDRDYDRPSVIRFLRGALSPLTAEETDQVENALIATGVRGWKRFQEPFVIRDKEEIVNDCRERLTARLRPITEGLGKGEKSVRDRMEILAVHLESGSYDLYHRLEQKADEWKEQKDTLREKEYRSLYPSVLAVMDMMVDMLGAETVSLKEFREILMAGIGSGMLGFAPPTRHQILIGDVERSRLDEVDVVFFLGNTDDRFPRGADTKGVLSEQERRRIGEAGIELAPSAGKLYERELFYLYRIVTKPAKKLILTYSRIDADGESKRPSYLIDRIRTLFGEELSVTIDDDDDSPEAAVGTDRGRSYLCLNRYDPAHHESPVWQSIFGYYKEHDPELVRLLGAPGRLDARDARISEDTASRLYGNEILASVTRFEKFALCPYAHFLYNGLCLRERDEYEIQPPDRGNIFHDSLELFFKKMQSAGLNWRTISEESLMKLSAECFEETTGGYRERVFFKDKRTEYKTHHMKRIFTDAIAYMHLQMKQGGFDQLRAELRFPEDFKDDAMRIHVDEAHSLSMKGRIDRLDIAETDRGELVKIIDYKSSDKILNPGMVLAGFQLQLITYLDVAMRYVKSLHPDRDVWPAAVLYQTIGEKEQEWIPDMDDPEKREWMMKKSFRSNGYFNRLHDIYITLDNDLNKESMTSVVVPAKTNKQKSDDPYPMLSGTGTNALPTYHFEEMMRTTREHIRDYGKRMFKGEIHARPAKSESTIDGCRYCEFQGVCGMENRNRTELERKIKILSATAAIQELNARMERESDREEEA